MNFLNFFNLKFIKNKKTPWRNNIDRLSKMLVIGTYSYSAYWLYLDKPLLTPLVIVLLSAFLISSYIRFSERFTNNTAFSYYAHLFIDLLLAAGISLVSKSYAMIPVIFALTALGSSDTDKRYVLAVTGVSVLSILGIEGVRHDLTAPLQIISEASGTLFNLLIIIGYARIISELSVQRHQLQKQKNKLSEKHEELERAYDALYKNMLEREVFAVQQERNRMSGEFHDHMGHAMASSLIQLQYVQKVMGKNPEKAQETLTQIHEHLNQSYEEIRRFVRTSQEIKPLQSGFKQFVKRIEDLQCISGLLVTVESGEGLCQWQLSESRETHLLRIIQETMTNSLKHGKAKQLGVNIDWAVYKGRRGVIITLADDGAGNIGIEPGYGLSSLENRVKQLGGEIFFETTPEQGFKTTILLPAETQEQELAV